jgi:hypothetical protein
LANSNVASHIFIEDLEPATVFLRFAGLSEATGAVEDLGERIEVDYIMKDDMFSGFLICKQIEEPVKLYSSFTWNKEAIAKGTYSQNQHSSPNPESRPG